ncbi:L-aspartate oxidase [Aeromicrobium sp. PE09-221]|uniref:L-aspartate oxidase n=1 Tax=Aeromicrobium sp. PE09-221 TaxID=1898043 RepID=UPI000B659CC4|nr:L-aspartate oxidase [Aeromicrobium sp. PE09-221]OUZ11301.1 L-aspartate oxidase [Aeromicrobium sp. PE09-221]
MSIEHVLVVGSGVAGLTAALAARGRGIDVTVVTKSYLTESATRYAQGGIAAVTSDDDSVEAHVRDTLGAGAGLSERSAAEVVCGAGAEAVADLLAAGVRFDVAEGRLARGLEAAHSHARILHADGDATGAAIARALAGRLLDSGARIHENTFVSGLVLGDGRVRGARLLDGSTIEADAVILATGGAGQLFSHTTNPAVATGDGLALALRAGAVLADLEFVQFHPTSLAFGGNALISEAVRGEGAVLRDAEGRRFMPDVHPDAELAPRDVVARAIAGRMREQNGAPAGLDATALGADFLARRFPGIDAMVRSHGVDWAEVPVPVTPAAHYLMGGIVTDTSARTTVRGLFAAGEVACTGLHGANRLASNSLLEGAVMGRRAVEALDLPWPVQQPFDGESVLVPVGRPREHAGRDDLQRLMWKNVGLERDRDLLDHAIGTLDAWSMGPASDVKSAEDDHLLLVARAVAHAALARQESRGAHWRADAPAPETTARHSAVRLEA